MTDPQESRPAHILVVDDDEAFRASTSALLRQEGYAVVEAARGQEGVEALQGGSFDLILLDLRMPGVDGIQVVEVLRRWGEGVPILMISGFGTVEKAVEALHTGADDFLTKPVEPDVLTTRVASLLERRPSLESERVPSQGDLVGRSPEMQEVFKSMRQVAPGDTTVLIQGETGTGKELVARGIHDASPRSDGPFLAVNCASLAENLLESELFGHVKGAFTGALQDKPGLFEAAQGGTIFLDEIGDVSSALQHRLLRVLQEKEILPVGHVTPREVDVRVLAATNKDLRLETEAGRFREDLYYRLNVFRLEIPPLRARKADIPLLVEAFLHRTGRGEERPGPWIVSPLATRLLQSHRWPGNVRELFAVLESALIRSGGTFPIEAHHLPEDIRESGSVASELGPLARYSPPVSEAAEKEAIVSALEQAGGVRAQAAKILGMGRTTLWRKMKEHGIEAADPDKQAL